MDFSDRFDPAGRVWTVQEDGEQMVACREGSNQDLGSKLTDFAEEDQELKADLKGMGIDLLEMRKALGSALLSGDDLQQYTDDLEQDVNRWSHENVSLKDAVADLAGEVQDSIGKFLSAGVADVEDQEDTSTNDAALLSEDWDESDLQPNCWTCGPAVVNYVRQLFALEPESIDDMAEELGASPDSGVDPSAIQQKLESDAALLTTEVSSVEELKEHAGNGEPVVMAVTLGDGTGHFIAVIGYNADTGIFTAFDPDHGTVEYEGEEDLPEWTMTTKDGEVKNWGLAVQNAEPLPEERTVGLPPDATDDEIADSAAEEFKEARVTGYMETYSCVSTSGVDLGMFPSMRAAKQAAVDASKMDPRSSFILKSIRVLAGNLNRAFARRWSFLPSTGAMQEIKDTPAKSAAKKSRAALQELPDFMDSFLEEPALAQLPIRISLGALSSVKGGHFAEVGEGLFRFLSKKGCGLDAYDGSMWELAENGAELTPILDSLRGPSLEPAPVTEVSFATFDQLTPVATDRLEDVADRVQNHMDRKRQISEEVQDLVRRVDRLVNIAEDVGIDVKGDDALMKELEVEPSPSPSPSPSRRGLGVEEANLSKGPTITSFGN